MTARSAGLVVLLALSGLACRSSLPEPPEAELPTPLPPLPSVPAEGAPVIASAPALDVLLEAAEDAATRGLIDEFRDCEILIAEALTQARGSSGGSAAFVAYAEGVLDELERLRQHLAFTEAGWDDVPPEPGPVPAERVAELEELSRREEFDLPVVMRPEVASLVDFYTGPYRERLIAALERAGRYLPFIRQELTRAGLPLDLAFLPLVESAFNPQARSRASAQGLWQFMASTARLYSLRCDGLIDERNDPELATRAAIAHLSDLFAHFGDWELALAAYNSGTGRVERAIRRSGGSRDFWTLRRHLPRETRNYVPAMWAALVVAKDPQRYGLPAIVETPACLGRVEVVGALDLAVLGERGPLSEAELATLNPALTYKLTPAKGSYQLAVPCGRENEVAAVIASIPPAERVRRFLHVVSRGDTLGVLAQRYGSSVATIMAANGIRDPRRLRIGQQLIIPRDPTRGGPLTYATTATRPARYVVKRGDTLFTIARRFGTTVEALQEINGLADTTIRIGDVLRLTH
jgi:membrane-bound lytic murein transglycosylase D